MITTLPVNGLDLVVEYALEITPVYLGDLESSYIDITIEKATWCGHDVLPLIDAFELRSTLELIIQDRFEDME